MRASPTRTAGSRLVLRLSRVAAAANLIAALWMVVALLLFERAALFPDTPRGTFFELSLAVATAGSIVAQMIGGATRLGFISGSAALSLALGILASPSIGIAFLPASLLWGVATSLHMVRGGVTAKALAVAAVGFVVAALVVVLGLMGTRPG